MSETRVTLEEILEALESEELLAWRPEVEGKEVRVMGVTTDSRKVEEGSVFCAFRGTDADGHAFLADAARAGASAAVVEHASDEVSLPQIVVHDGRRAAGVVAATFYGEPWKEVRTVAVTGTNGKTTTVFLLRHLLSTDAPAASIGTLGVIGREGAQVPGTFGLTTPGPVETARWLRGFVDEGVRWAAMEVSSHALDQRRTGEARFAAVALTNLSRDHLDYHRTFEAYREAKLRIIDLCEREGVVVVNADEEAWEGIDPGGRRMVRYGTDPSADVRAEDLETSMEGSSFTLRIGDERAPVRLSLIGPHNVTNALTAAGVAHGLGWEASRIAGALEALPQVPGRLERLAGGEGLPTVLCDYAHTPDAMVNVLRAVRSVVTGKVWLVFGATGDRDPGKRPEMGRVAVEEADIPILSMDNPRSEDPERIADAVEEGMGEAPHLRMLDRAEAIRHAVLSAAPEDAVVLAGKGHERYQDIKGEKHYFVEAEFVAEAVAERRGER